MKTIILIVKLLVVLQFVYAHDHPTKDEIQAELNEKTIYYGSTIRLRNQQTRHHIFSMDISYGSGSRSQVVTSIDSDSDMGSLFTIKSGYNHPIQTFEKVVKCGDTIRLEHSNTRKNIYAAGFASPISNKMEVSANGNNGENDNGNDNFLIECIGSKIGAELQGKHEFYLQNVPSGQYLSSSRRFSFNQSNCGFQCPIMGHLEVVCQRSKENESKWKITGGIIFQKNPWSNDEKDEDICEDDDDNYDDDDDAPCTKKAKVEEEDDEYETIDFSKRDDL